jgi:hypothetical protein
VLGAERRKIGAKLEALQTAEANAADSVESVAGLLRMLQAPLTTETADQFGRMADLLGKMGLVSPRHRATDSEQRSMLAIVNGIAADRLLQSKVEIVMSKADAARAAVSQRIVEVASRYWR